MQTFKVQGMTCGHCKRTVINAIQARDSSAKVEVDLETGLVQVEGSLAESEIREVIEEEGYQVQ